MTGRAGLSLPLGEMPKAERDTIKLEVSRQLSFKSVPFSYFHDMDSRTFRKTLRRNSTSAEKVLWFQLRTRKFMGLKFRRQHTIGRYTVDFYCDYLKLIVEVDGGIHDNQGQANYDQARTEELENYGYYIYRVDNEAVINHNEAVLDDLKLFIERHIFNGKHIRP